MPPGEVLESEDTLRGLRTGVLLAKRIMESWPDIPIVVLTNSRDPYVHQELDGSSRVKGIFEKPNTTPFEFAAIVREKIG